MVVDVSKAAQAPGKSRNGSEDIPMLQSAQVLLRSRCTQLHVFSRRQSKFEHEGVDHGPDSRCSRKPQYSGKMTTVAKCTMHEL